MIKIKTIGQLVNINIGATKSKIKIIIPGKNLINAVEFLQLKDTAFIIAFKYVSEDKKEVRTSLKNVLFRNLSINDDGESKIELWIEPEDADLKNLNLLRGKISDIVAIDKRKEG